MRHRESIIEWLGKIDVRGKRVVDWGAGTKPVINYVMGAPAHYTTIDKLTHVGADIVMDISKFIILGDMYDIAFCIEALEHVKDSRQLIGNIWRNLRTGGKLYMTVPFLFPIHSEEDYWRFTDQGLRLLLEENNFIVDKITATDDHQGWLVEATGKLL